jgi:fatty acid desaturase
MEEKKLKIEEVEIENQETPDLLNQEMNQEMDQEAQAQALMSLASDLKILKAYHRSTRNDIYLYGIGERRAVSKKERQKKKAKRRMAKKSKR